MERLRRLSRLFLPLVAVAVSATAADNLAPSSADCTFKIDTANSGPLKWRALSEIAEAVAPVYAPASLKGAPTKWTLPAFPIRSFIDKEIADKMTRDKIKWTVQSTDAEFLRRVTMDLTGEIPDPTTVKAFLTDTAADKRAKAIDRLLQSPAFVDRWTMWFGDLVQNVQVASSNVPGPQARNAYYIFIRDSFQAHKPYDTMVRELIAGSGASYTKGEANYWVRDIQLNGPIQDTYDNLAASTGERFLGMPLLCLSCHSGLGHLEQVNRGLVKKTRLDFWKTAAFFAKTRTTTQRDPASGTLERIVADIGSGGYNLNTDSGNKTPRLPVSGVSVVEPAFILTGETPTTDEVRREAYARMLTGNPQFARATVNYLWKELFGLGIVEPADSFDLARQDSATLAAGLTLQPSHPALITQLADSFIASRYDFRALMKLMVSSSTYQLSSRYVSGEWNETWTPYFARHYPRRLMAEQMVDALTSATGIGFTINIAGLPVVNKAMKLPDPLEGGAMRQILNNFSRGNRDDQMRSSESSIIQALALMNDRNVTDRIKGTNALSTVARTLVASKDPATIADTLYIATLSRYPTTEERAAAVAHLGSGDLTRKTEDLQYMLINRLEFMFN
jgi:hypothetical protein